MANHRKILLSGLEVNLGVHMKTNIACYISNNMQALPILWDIIKTETEPFNVRAMWVFESICMCNPKIYEEYLVEIAELFLISQNISINRMLSKLLMLNYIPVDHEGLIMNLAFDRLMDKSLPIGVRVNCMQIIYNLSKKYPEIGFELRSAIENEIGSGKPAFKSRGAKILKYLTQKHKF